MSFTARVVRCISLLNSREKFLRANRREISQSGGWSIHDISRRPWAPHNLMTPSGVENTPDSHEQRSTQRIARLRGSMARFTGLVLTSAVVAVIDDDRPSPNPLYDVVWISLPSPARDSSVIMPPRGKSRSARRRPAHLLANPGREWSLIAAGLPAVIILLVAGGGVAFGARAIPIVLSANALILSAWESSVRIKLAIGQFQAVMLGSRTLRSVCSSSWRT